MLESPDRGSGSRGRSSWRVVTPLTATGNSYARAVHRTSDGPSRLHAPGLAAGNRVVATTLTPVLNEEHHVRATVAALQDQDLNGAAEFIFIDGRSTDGTRAILEELAGVDPRIRILDNPARHTAAALNIGLRAARGEYVARVDAHTSYPPHYLSRAIQRLARGDVVWVAGPQRPVGRDRWSRRVALALSSSLATGGSNRWASDVDRRAGEVALRTGVFTGVWRRETLDRHAGWDEGWPINQDAELAARVHESGGRIVSLPELGADYAPRSSLQALARQYGRYGMYRAKTFLRHPWSLRPAQLALPGLVLDASCAVGGRGRVRRLARIGLIAYAGAVARESIRARDGRPNEALALAAVFVTMHVSWGLGFLLGLGRFARPSARRERLATDLMSRPASAPEPE
jgi:succinoglycan biosynthesis protein ExoA